MYTSQLHSLRERDHPLAVPLVPPGRSLLPPPAGDTISPTTWQRFHRSIPFLATSHVFRAR